MGSMIPCGEEKNKSAETPDTNIVCIRGQREESLAVFLLIALVLIAVVLVVLTIVLHEDTSFRLVGYRH